jgi:hypothetical protein
MKRPDHFLLLLGIWGTREALKERDLALAARCVIGTALAALIVGAVYLCPRPASPR